MKLSDLGELFARARQLSNLGQGSPFEAEHGFYLDAISPKVATLPDGWEQRLIRTELADGIVILFLEPNDAAVSKYARNEPRDREWLQAGIEAGILSISILEQRLRDTDFLDDEERQRALSAFDEDRRAALRVRNARDG